MSRKNSFRRQAAEGKPQKPTRPERIIRTKGSLTFDSYLCCGHKWLSVKACQEDERSLINKVILKPGQKLEFEMVCADCGAGCTFGDVAGRRKVVAYDRDWNYGIPKPEPEDVKQATKATPVDAPVTWEDGLAS